MDELDKAVQAHTCVMNVIMEKAVDMQKQITYMLCHLQKLTGEDHSKSWDEIKTLAKETGMDPLQFAVIKLCEK